MIEIQSRTLLETTAVPPRAVTTLVEVSLLFTKAAAAGTVPSVRTIADLVLAARGAPARASIPVTPQTISAYDEHPDIGSHNSYHLSWKYKRHYWKPQQNVDCQYKCRHGTLPQNTS